MLILEALWTLSMVKYATTSTPFQNKKMSGKHNVLTLRELCKQHHIIYEQQSKPIANKGQY